MESFSPGLCMLYEEDGVCNDHQVFFTHRLCARVLIYFGKINRMTLYIVSGDFYLHTYNIIQNVE